MIHSFQHLSVRANIKLTFWTPSRWPLLMLVNITKPPSWSWCVSWGHILYTMLYTYRYSSQCCDVFITIWFLRRHRFSHVHIRNQNDEDINSRRSGKSWENPEHLEIFWTSKLFSKPETVPTCSSVRVRQQLKSIFAQDHLPLWCNRGFFFPTTRPAHYHPTVLVGFCHTLLSILLSWAPQWYQGRTRILPPWTMWVNRFFFFGRLQARCFAPTII